jgi:hypothetical protein
MHTQSAPACCVRAAEAPQLSFRFTAISCGSIRQVNTLSHTLSHTHIHTHVLTYTCHIHKYLCVCVCVCVCVYLCTSCIASGREWSADVDTLPGPSMCVCVCVFSTAHCTCMCSARGQKPPNACCLSRRGAFLLVAGGLCTVAAAARQFFQVLKKVLHIRTLCSECTRALSFQNFCQIPPCSAPPGIFSPPD